MEINLYITMDVTPALEELFERLIEAVEGSNGDDNEDEYEADG